MSAHRSRTELPPPHLLARDYPHRALAGPLSCKCRLLRLQSASSPVPVVAEYPVAVRVLPLASRRCRACTDVPSTYGEVPGDQQGISARAERA